MPTAKLDPSKSSVVAAASLFVAGALVAAAATTFSGRGTFSDTWLIILVLAAANCTGAIVGLLFGIPRTRTDGGLSSKERFEPNSNLEEISDWLVKIIVGVGLVELSSVPQALKALGTYLGSGLSSGSASAIGVTTAVYGFTLGCLEGYLWSRLRLRIYLETAERLARQAAQEKAVVASLRQGTFSYGQTETISSLQRVAEEAVSATTTVGNGSIAPILWVDDHPENNRAMIESFRRLGIEVDIAESTTQGIQSIHARSYGLIITDLGRQEPDGYNDQAGVHLIEQVRLQDRDVPIFVFGTHRAVLETPTLTSAGATLVTNRARILFENAVGEVTTTDT